MAQPFSGDSSGPPPGYTLNPSSMSQEPPRKRPSKAWWFVGAGLLVLAGVAFVAGLVLALKPLTASATVFTASGHPVTVDVPPGSERAIYVRQGTAAQCQVTDSSGRQLPLRTVVGRFTYNEWVAVQRFDTGTGHLTFTCATVPPGASVRVGSLPSVGAFAGGIALAVLGPIALAIAGVVVLVVTAVRWATASRQPTGAAYPPPGV